MSKHNDQVFKRVVTGGLQKQHTAGVAQGAYAMCKVVLEKATDETKPVEQRLEDVIAFCEICTKLKDGQPVASGETETKS